MFNVSTAAAIIAAAAGGAPDHPRILVAKHGNRSRTGRGSAEALGALGVHVDAGPEVQAACLAQAGVCFCFAIHHHPAMRHASGPRRALGFHTIFNLLGPLTNPANAKRQLIGVYAHHLVEPMARTLAELGTEHAIVAHGLDGLDELTTTAPTKIARVQNGSVALETIDALDFGLARSTHADLQADGLDAAAEVVRSIVNGEHGPKRDIAVFNAAAALVVADHAPSFGAGIEQAAQAIDSGAARKTLDRLCEVSNG